MWSNRSSNALKRNIDDNRTHMSPRITNTECRPKGFEHGFETAYSTILKKACVLCL